ncbi:MAG TPA: tRNA pseudouridine(55) synthase TruB, partial [Solirubrobacterales bacterium]|nr:tRNA pseudouridine(55) synthase TruB [Solirubrobacterales bacterium]
MGHAGTLDPFATGLLVVLIGAATRLQRYLLELPKTY